MAPQTQLNRAAGRRTILKAGAAAAVAALARPAGAARREPTSLEQLREEYEQRVEAVAERFRARFVAGELRGWREGDAGETFEKHDQAPLHVLEEELLREVKGADAYLILACSRSQRLVDGAIPLEHADAAAAMAMALDVLRVARRCGWYVPAAGETPTNRELGLA